jgi:FkbM family methyltransferase
MANIAQHYVKILGEQKHVLRFVLSRILWRTRLCSLFSIDKGTYRLKFYPTALSAILWIDPQDRGSDEAFFRRYLREKDIVVDVGANIGDLSLTAASVVGTEGRVYSLEAHPRTYDFLQKNIALNKCSNITSFNVALGDRESQMLLSDIRGDDQNHISNNGQGISVRMERLDDLPILEQHIELLKIDVEGYEKFVLEGAPKTLDVVSCVYLESWEAHFSRYGYACRDVIDLLAKKGFTILKFNENDSVAPVNAEHSSRHLENLIAVRVLEDFLERTRFYFTE